MINRKVLQSPQAIKTNLKKVTATHKGRTIAFGVLIFFIVIIAGGIFYWNVSKATIIKNKIEKTVREKTNGLYKIKYDSLRLNELSGYLSISNMELMYDSTRYIALDKLGEGPAVLLNIHIPQIIASGVKTSRVLLNNEIVGRKLEIIRPVIDITYTNSTKNKPATVPPKEIFEQILGDLKLLQADTVVITDAQINTSTLKTKKVNIHMQDVSMTLVKLRVDSISNADTSRILFAEEVNISCRKITWLAGNKFYNYTADDISISSVNNQLRAKNFRVVPVMDEDAFVNAKPVQDYCFDLSFSDIQLQHIDMEQLFDAAIIADTMLIGPASLKIYCDVAIPSDIRNRKEQYPLHIIELIPVPVNIKKMILYNAFVEYKERSSITRQSGKVQFYNINANISNITNNKNVIAANNIMTADINAKFLNSTPLKTSWKIYLLHPQGRFDVSGSLAAMDARLFNPLTIPMGPSRINKGTIKSLEFNFSGNDAAMDGNMKLLYDDFNITMLERDKGATKMDRKSLQSAMANLLIINSNPKKHGDIREVQTHIDRNTNQSMFYLAWKSLFNGIEKTVGIRK